MKKGVIRTKRWWFKKAKAEGYDWADKALKNTKGSSYNNQISLSRSLSCAFVWEESPEGHDFWEKIYDGLTSKGL